MLKLVHVIELQYLPLQVCRGECLMLALLVGARAYATPSSQDHLGRHFLRDGLSAGFFPLLTYP